MANLYLIVPAIVVAQLLVHRCDGRANFSGSPIILIPGDGGTQIWAKLDKPSVPHYICYKHTDYYYLLWLSLEMWLRPYEIDCFIDNMKLHYNRTTHKTSNSPGVQTMIPEFGNTTSVEYLDSDDFRVSEYFGTIVETAVAKWNYTRGKDIRAAPFDFRKAPNELDDYFKKLEQLIEQTYYVNGNKKVTLMAHSLGNPTLLYFLNHRPQIWKDKFIKTFVSVSPPWGGSMKIMLVFASGYNLEQWSIVLPPLKMRVQQRTMPSSAFLLPSRYFWHSDEILVQTYTRNYTVNDYAQFFKDLNYTDGYAMFNDTKGLIEDFTPPGVEVRLTYGWGILTPKTLIYGKRKFPDSQPDFSTEDGDGTVGPPVRLAYGSGIPTPKTLIYGKGKFPDSQPDFSTEDGDGTVGLRSLLGAARWIGKQKQPVFVTNFPGGNHLGILKTPAFLEFLKDIVFN